MTTVRLPASICCDCGKRNNAASSPCSAEIPGPGDVSICFYCGYVGIYADDMTVRPLTDEEMHEVAGDPDLIAMQKALAQYRKENKQ